MTIKFSFGIAGNGIAGNKGNKKGATMRHPFNRLADLTPVSPLLVKGYWLYR